MSVMKYRVLSNAILIVSVILTSTGCERSPDGELDTQTAQGVLRSVPTFRPDSNWPRMPPQWRLGEVSSIAVDARNNAWFLHRPWTLPPNLAEMAAPHVLGFDSDGNFLGAWGGPGDGYEWPQREHGLQIDHQGFVWIGGHNCPTLNEPGLEPIADDQLLKFTLDGEFVMQIGRSNVSRGNAEQAHEIQSRRETALFVGHVRCLSWRLLGAAPV